MSAWIIYWIGIADDIKMTCIPFAIISGVIFFISFIGWKTLTELKEANARHSARAVAFYLFPVFFTTSLLAMFMPSSKTLAAMYFLPPLYNAVVENEEAKKLPDNVVGLANEWIEELKPNKEKKSEN